MIVRATNKLLKISGIKPVKFEDNNNDYLPGEWYANIVKTGKPGKLVILLFHNKAKISLLCPTKSLNIAIKQLPIRAKNYLIRHGFESLIKQFNLDSEIKIYTTNSKSTLGFMNQISADIEWHLNDEDSLDSFDFDVLEDVHARYLFSIVGKVGKYEKTVDILKRINESINN
jgi:hypothetical protein